MATARSIRLVLEGEYHQGPFAGEIWQTGCSFVEGDAGGVFPGGIRESLPQFDATVIGEASSDATWDVDWAWKGDSKATKAIQVQMADLALVFWNAIKGQATTNLRMTGLRINAIQADGHVIGGANVFTLKTPVAGTQAASSSLPNQLAVVASLRTGARGPAGRGRMFLPLNGSPATGGVIGSTAKTTVNTALVAWFKDTYDLPGPLASVVNATPLTYSSIGTVGVGDLYDTQRRRRNAIQENYVTAAVNH